MVSPPPSVFLVRNLTSTPSSNLLYPKENRETSELLYICKACHAVTKHDSACTYRNHLGSTVTETAGVTTDVANDPTVGAASPSISVPYVENRGEATNVANPLLRKTLVMALNIQHRDHRAVNLVWTLADRHTWTVTANESKVPQMSRDRCGVFPVAATCGRHGNGNSACSGRRLVLTIHRNFTMSVRPAIMSTLLFEHGDGRFGVTFGI